MDNFESIVHTHKHQEKRLSRINEFRLKQARKRRDEAVQAAHDRYAEEVRALTGGNDRIGVLALHRGAAANTFRWPWQRRSQVAAALAAPFAHALEPQVVVLDPEELLRRQGFPAPRPRGDG